MHKKVVLYGSLFTIIILLLACNASKQGKGATTRQTGASWPDPWPDGVCPVGQCYDFATRGCVTPGGAGAECCRSDLGEGGLPCYTRGSRMNEGSCKDIEGVATNCVWVCGNQC